MIERRESPAAESRPVVASVAISVSSLSIFNATCADNKDIAACEHRVSHQHKSRARAHNSADWPRALLADCSKAIMKYHSTAGFVFFERQCKNVLLRNAFNNQIRGTSEAEPFVVARISHKDAALCTQ